MLNIDYMALLSLSSKAGLIWPTETLTGLAPHLSIPEYAFHELAHAIQVLHFVTYVDLHDLTKVVDERTRALEPGVSRKQEALALRAAELLFERLGCTPEEVALLEDSNRMSAEVQDAGTREHHPRGGLGLIGQAYEDTPREEARSIADAVLELLRQWNVTMP